MSDPPNKGVPFPEVDRQAGELAALRRVLVASRGTFSLSIAVCNSPALRDHLITRLQSEYEGVHVVELPERTEDVYAVIREKIHGSSPSPLFVTNLERSLPSSDEKPVRSPVLRRLNGTRELWKQQHPYPVVFWVPEYVAGMLAIGARDLWAWRSHQFEFVPESLPAGGFAMPMFAGGLTLAGNLDEDRKRFRISELERRIADAGDPPPPEIAPHASDWLNELGYLFYVLGDLGQAETIHRKALGIEEKLGSLEGMAIQYGNLGVICQTRGDLDQAETMHKKSLAIEEKLGSLEGMANQYGNLGLIYQDRGDLDQAEKMFRKSLAIFEKLGHVEGIARDYGNLGLIYQDRGDLDQAEKMQRKALEIDEKLGRIEGMATDYGNLGGVYFTRGDLDQAEAMGRKSLEIDEKLGRLEGMARDYSNLASIYKHRGDLKSAREYWTKARDLYAKIGMPHMVKKVQSWLDELPP